jgi:hypothetical protein
MTPEETEERIHEAIEMDIREFIPRKCSALVARLKEAKENIRNKKENPGRPLIFLQI